MALLVLPGRSDTQFVHRQASSFSIPIGAAFAIGALLMQLVAAPVAAHSAAGIEQTSDVAARFQLQVPVLYYHHVECASPDTLDPSLYICPDQFEAQMSYLHDQGWTTITSDQLADLMANRECPPAKVFVASFDDGPEDGYTNAASILERYGMHGTFFVTTGVPDALRPGRMTWDQMRDLISRGHAIGNHTETHLSLNKELGDVIQVQIEGAQQILQQQLGYRPRTFAYPYGRYNDLVIAQVAASGFDLAFTVRPGAKEASDDPFEAHRIGVASNASGADVLAQLNPFSEGCRPPTPDLSVALSSSGPFKGDGVYAATAKRSQSLTRTGVKVGRTYRYWLRIDNDAQQAGQFSIVPAITGTAAMDVSYRTNGVDVTSALKSGTYVTPTLQPWTSMTMVIRVTPRSPRVVGQSKTDTLRATSSTDPTRVDVAQVVATY